MDDFITNVYLTLQGQLVEPVEGVEDIFFQMLSFFVPVHIIYMYVFQKTY